MHPDLPGIQNAIAAVEAQRDVLGDATTEMALMPLRQALADRGVVPDGTRIRHLAILFVDTVGSTSTARQLDPEDFHELIDGALRRFTTVVEAVNGRVLKYTGDGLLAAFGSTSGSETDAEQAVFAGLGMIEATRLIRTTASNAADRTFEIRVGIHVGMVLVGGGVEGERHVSGTVVNLASRMEQAAPVGGLRISQATFELVRGQFDVIKDPATALKGVDGTVSTYLVIRPSPGNRGTRQRGIDDVSTPMVARQEQLATLQQAYLAVEAGGGLRAVLVTADAGVGKSRLLREFSGWLSADPRSATVLSAEAGPRSVHQPFGLIRDAIANLVGIIDSDPIERARYRFTRALRPFFPSDADAGEMLVLGHLIGLDFSQSAPVAGIVTDPEQVRLRGGRALASMFRQMSIGVDGPTPVVLVLDDLHWAEDATLGLLAELVTRRSDLSLLLVLGARPALVRDRVEWVSTMGAGDRLGMIELDPLDEMSASELGRSMLRRLADVPTELKIALARADGNPFFMEELVRMMLTEGVIETAPDGSWQLAPDRLRDLSVPGTLMALLQSRVDGLDAADRRTLQQASVVGYVFWDRAVEALALGPPEANPVIVEARAHPDPSAPISPLVDRGLVVERPHSTLNDAAEFAFRHHLLQQFAYSTLLRRDRQRYHAQVAGWLDALAVATGTQIPGLTADHYERAGQHEEAARRYATAAADAGQRGATESAVTFARRGLELVAKRDLSTRWLLTAELEGLMYHMGDRVAQADAIGMLITLADALDDGQRRAEAAYRHMSLLFTKADLEGAVAAAVPAVAFATAAGDALLHARVLSLESTAQRQLGRLDDALNTSREALALARACADRSVESIVLAGLSVVLTEMGDLVGGRDTALAGLDISRERGDGFGIADGLNVVGYASLGLGDLGVARQEFAASHREATEVGWLFVQAASLKNLALVLLLCGEYEDAASVGERAAELALESASRDIAARALTTVGLARTALLDDDGARATLERAHALHLEVGAPHCAIEAVAAMAALDLRCVDLDAALTGVSRVLAFLADGHRLDGVNEPFRPRWICWQVLTSAGDPRAGVVLDEAYTALLDRAGRIRDEETRARFLDEIPYHREIISTWEAERSTR